MQAAFYWILLSKIIRHISRHLPALVKSKIHLIFWIERPSKFCEFILFRHVTEYLNTLVAKLAKDRDLPSVHHLTQDFHVWPDFHGNRSPIADPNIKGMISGLTMSPTEQNLAITYLAFVQAIAVSTRDLYAILHFTNCFSFASTVRYSTHSGLAERKWPNAIQFVIDLRWFEQKSIVH